VIESLILDDLTGPGASRSDSRERLLEFLDRPFDLAEAREYDVERWREKNREASRARQNALPAGVDPWAAAPKA